MLAHSRALTLHRGLATVRYSRYAFEGAFPMKPFVVSTPSSDDLVVEGLGDELLIYDRRSDVAHCLGSTATLVWRTCEGGASLDDIAHQLTTYGIATSDEDAVEVAQIAVSELEEKGLL